MIRRNLSIVCLLLISGVAVAQNAQPATDDFKPASTNVVGPDYPQVNSHRQVRCRMHAPQGLGIRVVRPRQVKGEDGFFTRVTAPQDPGFPYYQVALDGIAVADPNSESFFGSGN